MENSSQAKLFTKLVTILKEAKSVKKSGHNKHQNYQYATEADIMEVVRDQLIKQNIFVFTSSKTVDVHKLNKYDRDGTIVGENLVTIVETSHTFADAESGATYTVSGTGSGFDNTDKGVYKALTGAMKYFLSKSFLISSEDDPEADGANTSYVRNKTEEKKTFSAIKTSAETNTKEVIPKKEEVKLEQPKLETKTLSEKTKTKTFGQRKFIAKEPSF